MMDSMYPAGDAPQGQGQDQGEGGDGGPGQEQSGQETALLPLSLFGAQELREGETVTLEIVAMHEDEVEVKPAASKEKMERKKMYERPEMEKATSKLGMMES